MSIRNKLLSINAILLFVLLLVGCSHDSSKYSSENSPPLPKSSTEIVELENDESSTLKPSTSSDEKNLNGTETNKEPESEKVITELDNTNGNSTSEKKKEISLSKYSAQEIEYARIWLQLGPTQDIDALSVQTFHEGEPLNPNDETSANYPEDVIHLSGSRLAEGSITYSGNGDGTINVYKVPHRWDGKYPAGEQFYIDFFINDTKLVKVGTGDNEKIVELIDKMFIQ
ncbi:hypothetical protein KGR20_23765 [Cytobacillus oceanisediminis]|uniref:Lipoprotein n=3 Tax=Niallia TaxID=2837506 RepID=A0A941JRM3_NIACI|nr:MULTISPECIES: hypothetical protein [Bacillaceae]EOR21418.1 lipoprotein, putative [Niallia nealsonii AAU1]MBQ6449063.1 hypothetical protein [Bacillus sp. (in: firmicutes)]MBZ9537168.1 hypothetical protein [Cytobacillus oceanisediminis]MCB5238558.1 hypothetical protein [Niallia circulans]NMO77615.1 hypothetical protein [Niallia alba]